MHQSPSSPASTPSSSPTSARKAKVLSVIEPLQVSVATAALLLDYSKRTVRRLIAKGDLETVGQGRLLRILMASILAYQRRHRVSPALPSSDAPDDLASCPSPEGEPT